MANWKEQWLPIDGHPRYEISNKGKVYSHITHKELTPKPYGAGNVVSLNSVKTRVDRLVLSHFVTKYGETNRVIHKDGDNFNDYVTNLRWCTQEEYREHFTATHRRKSRSKVTADMLNEIIQYRIDGATLDEIAQVFGISASYANILCRKHLTKRNARTVDGARVIKWWYLGEVSPDKWPDGATPRNTRDNSGHA